MGLEPEDFPYQRGILITLSYSLLLKILDQSSVKAKQADDIL